MPDREDPDPRRVAAPLDRLMRHLGAPKVATVRSLFDRWPDAVGEQVASQASPLSLKDGVLLVGVDDPAWATQLKFLEAELLARLAAEFGPDEVTAIEVRVRRRGGFAGR